MEILRLLCISILCFRFQVKAWIPNVRVNKVRASIPALNAVETISLKELGNHEEEGSLMADSLVKWLDDEWMPQEVHVKMGKSAKLSYIFCRSEGQDDVMDVLMQIANDLEANWQEYDADAFVNAWDIGNYCSDYLVKRSGNEGCECSSEIY